MTNMTNESSSVPVELEFYAKAEHLADVRRLVERLATKSSLNREQVSDFLTAVDEATANAIRHGSPQGERNLVRVVCHPLPDALIVEVRDQGTGFATSAMPAMPPPDAQGGRGLPLMCALADKVEVASTPRGTTVTLKKVGRPTSASPAKS